MNSKYWNVNLTSDVLVMNITVTRVPAFDAKDAEYQALSLMKNADDWRVVSVDRV